MIDRIGIASNYFLCDCVKYFVLLCLLIEYFIKFEGVVLPGVVDINRGVFGDKNLDTIVFRLYS